MHTVQKINYTRLFWIFNVSGWILYVASELFLNFDEVRQFPRILYYFGSFIYAFLLTLLMRRILQKYLSKSRQLKNTLLLVFLVSISATTIWYITDKLFYFFIPYPGKPDYSFLQYMDYMFGGTRYFKSLIFWTIPLFIWSILYVAIKTWFELVIEKEKREKAFLLAQQAQLKMLRYQLNPHFLFNSLSSIQALIYENQRMGDKMLTELSEFLRYTLSHVNKTYVPFKEELEAIQRYLTIEKIRFEEKLEYDIHCSPEAGNYEVLSFLIQPLIENAIKHGIKTSEIPLKIRINGKVVNNTLLIGISNTGQWVHNKNEGTGIANLRERLENAYQNRHSFQTFENDGWVIVQLEIEHKENHIQQ